MKKFGLRNVKATLKKCGADETDIELVLMNVSLVNDLIDEYVHENTKHNAYLIYKISLQIINMLSKLKKANKSITDDDEDFKAIVDSIKTNKEKPIGFAVNKQDLETR